MAVYQKPKCAVMAWWV